MFLSLQSKTEPMSAESFLERYSLPRIARLIAPKAYYDEQQKKLFTQSSSMLSKSKKSNGSNSQLLITSNQLQSTDMNFSDDIKVDKSNNGELFLLYRNLKKFKVYHAVNAKNITNRKKGIKIPQDFTGESQFSTLSLSYAI
jgi:hypothetical protein